MTDLFLGDGQMYGGGEFECYYCGHEAGRDTPILWYPDQRMYAHSGCWLVFGPGSR